MSLDPTTIDLSLVEPALRPETLRRIIILEEFRGSRGVAARQKACDALGLSKDQLYILSRAWNARRRAEDVTTRATKRSRPTTLADGIIELIGETADEMPDETIAAIANRVSEKARQCGITPPTYPTVNRYVREHLATKGAAAIRSVAGDLHVDIIVSDIPVLTEDGQRIRPHVAVLIDGGSALSCSMIVKTADVDASDIALLLQTAIRRTRDPAVGIDPDQRPPFLSVTLPASGPSLEDVARLVGPAGFCAWSRSGSLAPAGKMATTLFGTALAGYKLRPRLIGRSSVKRTAAHPNIAGATENDGSKYLITMANSDNAPDSVFDRIGRLARAQFVDALTAASRSI